MTKFHFGLFWIAIAGGVATLNAESSRLRGTDHQTKRGLAPHGFNEILGQCRGANCGLYGDPHIVTCDGLIYDCMGLGLFTLMKNHMYNIQGNFLDVGAHEHGIVRHWGYTQGAAITNDVVIDYVLDPARPVVQLGFPTELEKYKVEPPSEEGCTEWHYWAKVDMYGHRRSEAKTVQDCRARCEGVAGCTHFSWWHGGYCHITDGTGWHGQGTNDLVATPRAWSRSLAGTMDSECGKVHAPPPLANAEEEDKHVTMQNNCPVLLYLDGHLQDLSDAQPDSYLLGSAESDHSIYMEGNSHIRIVHRTEDDDVSEIYLIPKGDGPGEIWSCHWDFWICLPASQQEQFTETTVGLLGTPDGNTQNDWMDQEGNTFQPLIWGPEGQERMINYCYDNWCVSQEDSLLAYPAGTTYEDFKCADEPFRDFREDLDDCVLSAQKIEAVCADEPPLLIHACKVDCCMGGCSEQPETVEEIEEIKPLGGDDDELGDPEETDVMYYLPPTLCVDHYFDQTGTTVCPSTIDEETEQEDLTNIVTLLHSSGSQELPEYADIFYGIVLDPEPMDDATGKLLRFRVNNPFATAADLYIRHEAAYGDGFLNTRCQQAEAVEPGCLHDAPEVEVGCVEREGHTPYAMVTLYFAASGLSAEDPATIATCCHAPGYDEGVGIASYTFEIKCECPSGVATV